MPELPDVTVYVESLDRLLTGRVLERVRLRSFFLVRTAAPPLRAAEGRRVVGFRRLGKRVVFELEDGLFLVLHLRIAGRLHWRKAGAGVPGKVGLAAFDFEHGTLLLTEASPKKRASLHVVEGEAALGAHDPGGIELEGSTVEAFRAALTRESHTVKRALTDPRFVAGIGNAYSDEILHAAHLSPAALTGRLNDEDWTRLHAAALDVLRRFTDLVRAHAAESGGFPEKVTAFRPEMAVHGRHREPCPVCSAPVQRIVSAERESNYCARCQTGGRVLRDRVLSRLLHDAWPASIEELG